MGWYVLGHPQSASGATLTRWSEAGEFKGADHLGKPHTNKKERVVCTGILALR